jgi:hypothetical protein
MFAADELSTWGESRDPLFPDWFNMGGDARHAYTKTETKEAFFPMAMNMSLAIEPMKGLTGVISGGLYSREKKTEFHQAYLIYSHKLNKKTTVNTRAGKFMPNYGIMTPDHTRAIRRYHLIRRDQETLNVEGSVIGRFGSIFVTGILGETDLGEDYGLSYKKSFRAKQGYSAKTSLFLGKDTTLSYSLMALTMGMEEKQSHAISMTTAITSNSYYMGQVDYQESQDVTSHEIGYEILKGLLVYVGLDQTSEVDTELAGIRWFPYPHFEFQTEWKDDSFLGQLHYYF